MLSTSPFVHSENLFLTKRGKLPALNQTIPESNSHSSSFNILGSASYSCKFVAQPCEAAVIKLLQIGSKWLAFFLHGFLITQGGVLVTTVICGSPWPPFFIGWFRTTIILLGVKIIIRIPEVKASIRQEGFCRNESLEQNPKRTLLDLNQGNLPKSPISSTSNYVLRIGVFQPSRAFSEKV